MDKKRYILLTTLLCSLFMSAMWTSCDEDDKTEDKRTTSNIILNLGDLTVKPYLNFGVTLEEVEKYMTENYPEWNTENPDALIKQEQESGCFWSREYSFGKYIIAFYFTEQEGRNMLFVSYDGYDSTPLQTLISEVERNGFIQKGEPKYPDYNADICYMYLSEDEKLEVQVAYWEKEGGSWSVSFQPFDSRDLKYLVTK